VPTTPKIKKDHNSSKIEESQANNVESETKEFIDSPAFDSISKLDSTFVSAQDIVNKGPLEIIFRSSNVDSIVDKMNAMVFNRKP
jgi:hypothetical protein